MESTKLADNLNEATLKKIILDFERRVLDNQNQRIKHDDDPAKFAASETELFASLDQIQAVSTQPELYQVLIAKKTLVTLVSLIHHDNTDISAKVISILQEFTDIDDGENKEAFELLILALIEENVIPSIASNVQRFNEAIKEEAQAINDSLTIVENILDFDPGIATKGISELIEWMLKKLSQDVKKFHPVKLSISELLSVLLMSDKENRESFREYKGFDILLRQVDHYRAVAPETGDEHEFLEQIVNSLCTAVFDNDANKLSFAEEGGVDLIRLILKEKREAVKQSNIKLSMLKLFNHLLTSDKNQDPCITSCCEDFIKDLGLKVLFPLFTNPKHILNSKVKRREFYQVLDEVEEHTVAIILALLKYCKNTDLIQRVLIKFAESNFEKLDRLIQLHDKYFKLVSQLDDQNDDDDDDNEDKDKTIKSKSSSHFTLRSIDYILLLVCYLGNQFETYDPTSGETLTNRVANKLLTRRPELGHQIVFEVRKHINEVESTSLEEQNSLELLLKYFEQLKAAS